MQNINFIADLTDTVTSHIFPLPLKIGTVYLQLQKKSEIK